MLRGGKLYDVLLVVERTRFNQSCALLDAALPLQPEVRPSAWCALLSKHTVTHASERYKEQEHELMGDQKREWQRIDHQFDYQGVDEQGR